MEAKAARNIALESAEQNPSCAEGCLPIEDEFLWMLNRAIDDAKDTLLERFDYITSQNPASAKFMWENGLMEGYNPEEGIISAMKHGTLAVG